MGILTDYLVHDGAPRRRGKLKPGSPTVLPPESVNNPKWRVGSLSAIIDPYQYTVPAFDRYTDTNRASTLKPGENYLDNKPAGVPVVDASTISLTRDLGELLRLADSTLTGPAYIRGDGGIYDLNSLIQYGTSANPNWLGYVNSNKRVMGLIDLTVRASKSLVASQPEAVSYVLNAVPGSPGNPVPISALYFSNSGSTVPLFFSGVKFQGRLQEPFSVFSEATRASSSFRQNSNAPTPLPYRGISIWRGITGAVMQYCDLDGWGFTISTAPPFEMGAIDSNYDGGIRYRRIHIDGRIHGSIMASRPRASGGLMGNKTDLVHYEDLYQGNTRRSGFAYNTNRYIYTERMHIKNFQQEGIANDFSDGWGGDNGYFPNSNLEQWLGQAVYDRCLFNNPGRYHFALATPKYGMDAVTPVVVPHDKPLIVIPRGMFTDDTQYGGCIGIRVIRMPNRQQLSPAYERITAVGIDASGYFDVRNFDGVPMKGVFTRDFKAAIHTPDKYFVVHDN